jgi:hypothetical protein
MYICIDTVLVMSGVDRRKSMASSVRGLIRAVAVTNIRSGGIGGRYGKARARAKGLAWACGERACLRAEKVLLRQQLPRREALVKAIEFGEAEELRDMKRRLTKINRRFGVEKAATEKANA